jgi:hypothetical protein
MYILYIFHYNYYIKIANQIYKLSFVPLWKGKSSHSNHLLAGQPNLKTLNHGQMAADN